MLPSKLKYIKFKNFRNFGNEPVTLTFESQINLLIGRNNVGKSNILRFLQLLSDLAQQSLFINHYKESKQIPFVVDVDNHHRLSTLTPIEVEIWVEPDSSLSDRVKNLKNSPLFIAYEIGHAEPAHTLTHKRNFFNDIGQSDFEEQYQSYLNEISNREAADYEGQIMRMTHHYFISREVQRSIPKIEYINETRSIDDALVKRINDIVNFNYRNQANKVKRDRLYAYLKAVFGYEVKVLVFASENTKPANKKIELVIGDDQYPLGSLGSGLEQIVILAFHIITSDADVICIDEPEMHLHAAAQRALLNMMSKIVDKQFFLATHSNHFLDYEVTNKKVFQIAEKNGKAKILETVQLNSLYTVIDDLGVRASELYQANGIIWVEGPSDRVYIKRWLELRHPALKEGLQFSFQFYGGKILKHYSVSDQDVIDFVSLLKINNNAFVVMDSDMQHSFTNDQLNPTKQRIILECNNCNINYWVTSGKEIENYLSNSLLTLVEGKDIERIIYEPIGGYCTKFSSNRKILFAREVCEVMTAREFESNEDLSDKIDLLARQILSWNV